MLYVKVFLLRCFLLTCFSFAFLRAIILSDQRMKAVVINSFGSASLLHVEDIPIPKISENQLLIRVKAAGINPIDAYMRSGRRIEATFPFVLGKEISGFVEQVNCTNTTLKNGDRVFCTTDYGGYAEYAVANATRCFALPEKLSFSQGAALYLTYFTAFKALILRGNLRDGDAVLIHGGSATVATAAVQVAKHIGATVVAAVGGPDYERFMKRAGANHIVQYHSIEDAYLTDALQQIKREKFNIILEIVSKVNLERDAKFLAKDGRIVAIGNRVFITLSTHSIKDLTPAIHNVGMFEYNESEEKQAAAYIMDGIEDGCIWPYVSKEFSIRQAPRAHKLIAFGKSASGKLVFVL